MIIFLRKIPAATKLSEIADFVRPAVKGGVFRKNGRIVAVKILVLKDARVNTVEFHGLVTVEPDSVGERVIKQLKGRRFKGKQIIIRQYFQRSWHNDPRQHQSVGQKEMFLERRKADRRRGKDLEVIQDFADKFSSQGDFVRKTL